MIFKTKNEDSASVIAPPTEVVAPAGPAETVEEPKIDYEFTIPRQGEWSLSCVELPDGRVKWVLSETYRRESAYDYTPSGNTWRGISANLRDARNSARYKQDEAMRDRIVYPETFTEKLKPWKPKELSYDEDD